jgi:hypothetical protein
MKMGLLFYSTNTDKWLSYHQQNKEEIQAMLQHANVDILTA